MPSSIASVTPSPTTAPPPTLTLTTPAPTIAAPATEPTELSVTEACTSRVGTVESVSIPSPDTGPIRARIYLPPCYAGHRERRYPVLYLLHGRGFAEDQWERLGAVAGADELIAAGEIAPLLIVMPRDPGERFDPALVEAVIPYVDSTYRTVAERAARAIGGLSRGGGWAVHFGLKYAETFGRLGLHSPAVFYDDEYNILEWSRRLRDRPKPAVYLDVGEGDGSRHSSAWLDQVFTWFDFRHTYIVRPGGHTERYWAGHVREYLKFYAADWREATWNTERDAAEPAP
ncbi:MAG: alpha/beta hydrolase-fold protein [Anaerolineales bacterium]|nr:alpha/beta hydrolase-fold protein [Anaerolineales bacterium]